MIKGRIVRMDTFKKNLEKNRSDNREQEVTEKLNVYHEEIYFQNKELLRAQEELEKSKKSYEELFKHAPTPYIIISKDSELIKVNDAFSELVGVLSLDLIGEKLTDYIHSKDQDSFYFHKNTVLKEEDCQGIRLRINDKPVIMTSNVIELDANKHLKSIIVEVPVEK